MSHSRRNLLRALSVGGVVGATQLPASWSKPVVDAVVLPAHAQTTGGFFGSGSTLIATRVPGDSAPRAVADIARYALDSLVSEAQAISHNPLLWPVLAAPTNYMANLDPSGNLTIRLESLAPVRMLLGAQRDDPLLGFIAEAHAGEEVQLPQMMWVSEEAPQGCYAGLIDTGDFRPLSGVSCEAFGPASARIVSRSPDQVDGEVRLDNFSGLTFDFSVFPGGAEIDCSDCFSPELVVCEDGCL